MHNLFHAADAGSIIDRINRLTTQSKARWGKMNVAQMLAHCSEPLRVALGESRLKKTFIGFLFGKMVKRKFLNGGGFKKNLPTDKTFVKVGQHELETERQRLIGNIQRIASARPEDFADKVHPFFGKMTQEEWGKLSYLHLDHHLQQFGV